LRVSSLGGVASDFLKPNGLAFSPDVSILYMVSIVWQCKAVQSRSGRVRRSIMNAVLESVEHSCNNVWSIAVF
jgi:sugar lactone lactonase YvrE